MTKSTIIRRGHATLDLLPRLANGTIQGTKRRSDLIEAEFWLRVKKSSPSQCWIWTGGMQENKKGKNYGVVSINGKKWKAHRLAWSFTNGPIPDSLKVLHKCDNPPCCNPNHLFTGTQKDNVEDCILKGRGNRERGATRYNAVLTDDDIRSIRKRYKARDAKNGGAALAKEFGVGKTMISAIVKLKRWKHVN